jgi:hypothetical protein
MDEYGTESTNLDIAIRYPSGSLDWIKFDCADSVALLNSKILQSKLPPNTRKGDFALYRGRVFELILDLDFEEGMNFPTFQDIGMCDADSIDGAIIYVMKKKPRAVEDDTLTECSEIHICDSAKVRQMSFNTKKGRSGHIRTFKKGLSSRN